MTRPRTPATVLQAEIAVLLTNAEFQDGQGIVLTQDMEAVEDAVETICNSHNELVAALREITRLEHLFELSERVRMGRMADKARAALAKAEQT